MRRQLPAIALGALVALAALAVVVAVRPGPEPSAAERGEALASELRCPDCQGLSVADSPTSSAREIRRQIDELLAGGASDDEVRAHFVARYGQWIRLAPSAVLFWIVPFVALALGVALLAVRLRGSRPAAGRAAKTLSAEERRRLHEEAEALDA